MGPAACSQAPTQPLRPSITIFAAASLTDVVDRIATHWTDQTGIEVVISAGGSSTLARQIEAGAVADVFLSADQQWVDYLDDGQLIETDSPSAFASNRLVFIAPSGSDLEISMDRSFDFSVAFTGRLSLADPDLVPAGRYAMRALESLGWWADVELRLAPALDVRSALAFVARGEADLGIVYRTDAAERSDVQIVGEIDSAHSGPIRYVGCVVKGAKPPARAFLAFMTSDLAARELHDAGFLTLRPIEP